MKCKCGNKLGAYTTRAGNRKLRKTCDPCRRKPWNKHKKNKCDFCGFIPIWKGQLDVDHIDGNSSNNDPSNFQTLCANCHRLKTFLAEDFNNRPGA